MLKRSVACALLAACLLLAGCGEAAAPASAPSAPSAPAAAPIGDGGGGQLEYLSDSPDSIGRGAEGELGYYYVAPAENGADHANLHFIDGASGQDIVLCSSPSCTHDSDACPACFSRTPSVVFTGGRLGLLFGSISGGDEPQPAQLDLMEADGSGRRTVYTFEANQEFGGSVAGDGENLYFLLATYQGAVPTMSLARLNLTQGSLTDLCEVDNSTFLVGVACGKLLIKTISGSPLDAAPGSDESAIQQAFMGQRHCLKAVDPATGEVTELLDWGQDEYWELVADDTLYLFSARQGRIHLTARDLATGADSEYDLDLSIGEDGYIMSASKHNGTLLFDLYTGPAGGTLDVYHWAYSPETGEVREITLYDPVRGYPVRLMGTVGERAVLEVPRYAGNDLYSFDRYEYVVCSWEDYLNSKLPE